jgi:hypothetical protein
MKIGLYFILINDGVDLIIDLQGPLI